VAGVTVRLVRERMQALSSRYGRVFIIKAGVILCPIGTLLHGLSVLL
jgi:hypothetical protein